MKTLLVTLGLFIGSLFGNIVQAAPEDCIGMGGEVACTEPVVRWQSIY